MKLTFRKAREEDVMAMVELLADDSLGQHREDTSKPLNKNYLLAFKQINSDPNNELIVASDNQLIVAVLQLTFIPYLTHQGSWRCLVEGVRIYRKYRGLGVGTKLFDWAIKRAEAKACGIVQLSSDKQRPDAIRFYQNLGFVATHEGLKLALNTKSNDTSQ